jgi:hypothetical protein
MYGATLLCSYLAMSHGTRDFMSEEARAQFDSWADRDRARSRDAALPRSRPEFARFFDGLRVVPPGIGVARMAQRGSPTMRPSAADVGFYAAVARIP